MIIIIIIITPSFKTLVAKFEKKSTKLCSMYYLKLFLSNLFFFIKLFSFKNKKIYTLTSLCTM